MPRPESTEYQHVQPLRRGRSRDGNPRLPQPACTAGPAAISIILHCTDFETIDILFTIKMHTLAKNVHFSTHLLGFSQCDIRDFRAFPTRAGRGSPPARHPHRPTAPEASPHHTAPKNAAPQPFHAPGPRGGASHPNFPDTCASPALSVRLSAPPRPSYPSRALPRRSCQAGAAPPRATSRLP